MSTEAARSGVEKRPISEDLQIPEARVLQSALDECALFAITDRRGQVLFANERLCALSKYSREEFRGKAFPPIDPRHHPPKFLREMWNVLNSGSVWHGDIKNLAKDGTCFWVATTIVPCLDQQKEARQFIAIGADVTEQKRIEAELAERLLLQRLLADLSSLFVAVSPARVDTAIEDAQKLIVEALGIDRCALWQVAPDGENLVKTHAWQREEWPMLPKHLPIANPLPWSHAKIMRGEFVQFSSVDELPPEAAQDARLFRSIGQKSNVTFPLIANGQVFGALAFVTLTSERAWRNDEIEALNLVAQVMCNVVGRQRAEAREELLRQELAHAMRVATLGEMIAALAHELNQPLAAILSNTQAARRFIANGNVDANELNSILDDISRDDKRAGAVIQNLRAMVSKRPAAREACCLNGLAHEVVALLHSELIEYSVEARLSLESELPKVHAARVELQQVLVNLILNAAHAMRETPIQSRFVDITTSSDAKQVKFIIRDYGTGLSPERLTSIFSPFFSTKPDGLGMGLSICRRIAENHAGSLIAQNHADGGATFIFSLPAK